MHVNEERAWKKFQDANNNIVNENLHLQEKKW